MITPYYWRQIITLTNMSPLKNRTVIDDDHGYCLDALEVLGAGSTVRVAERPEPRLCLREPQ